MHMEPEPVRPTTCDRCGKPFNTSGVHPSRYCSIACEEGRSPLPQSDPAAPDYHVHLQGAPESLVGRSLVATALKRTCYSPEWHRPPQSYPSRDIVSHDEEDEILVIKTDVHLGTVANYDKSAGRYLVEWENPETGDLRWRSYDASLVVSQIRKDRWWVDG